jgi:hypothetical protein
MHDEVTIERELTQHTISGVRNVRFGCFINHLTSSKVRLWAVIHLIIATSRPS